MFAYRSSVHSTTGLTPFEIVYGRKAVLPIDIQYELTSSSDGSYYASLKQRLDVIKEKVYKRTLAAKRTQKKQYDKTINFESYKEGEKVRVYNPSHKPGLSGKLTHRWSKPMTITEKISELLYKILDNDTGKQKLIHFNRLKKCELNESDTKNATFPTIIEEQFTDPKIDTQTDPKSVKDKTIESVVLSDTTSESNTEEIESPEMTDDEEESTTNSPRIDGNQQPLTTQMEDAHRHMPYNLRRNPKQIDKFQVKH